MLGGAARVLQVARPFKLKYLAVLPDLSILFPTAFSSFQEGTRFSNL